MESLRVVEVVEIGPRGGPEKDWVRARLSDGSVQKFVMTKSTPIEGSIFESEVWTSNGGPHG